MVQADIGNGWSSLWDPEAEKEGEHGQFIPVREVPAV